MSCECWDPDDICTDCQSCISCCGCPTTISDVVAALFLLPFFVVIVLPWELTSWAISKLTDDNT